MSDARHVPSGGRYGGGGSILHSTSRAMQRLESASSWVWLTGMLCLGVATVLAVCALATYLTPFLGRGPAGEVYGSMALVAGLERLALVLHGVCVLALGLAGAVVLYRAWHPYVVWRGRESDPVWVRKLIRGWDWLARHPLDLAWRATYIAAILAALALVYGHYGEALGLSFAVEPDAMAARLVTPLALFVWPGIFVCLANVYGVRKHFLREGAKFGELVQPRDVADLMHPRDVRPFGGGTRGRFGTPSTAEGLMAPIRALVAFLQVRTAALRLRTAEIGQTDVQSDWVSQQALRGFRWGRDHRLSESNAWSLAIHAGILFVPLILAFVTNQIACIAPHTLPRVVGRDPGPKKRAYKVKIVTKRKFVVNPFSSIIFIQIDPRKMTVIDEKLLDRPWTGRRPAKSTKNSDKDGEGEGEGRFGLDGPVPGGAVRFTRLQHNGADWNRNVDLGADRLMLQEFHVRSEGIPVARRTESVTISQLRHFPMKGAPPFIYVTGRKPFGVSAEEARYLREYLLEKGGLIIGDSPGDSFASCFWTMIARVLGGQARWTEIPNDDEVFRRPCYLPNGAPPLWHHDGRRAKGIKVNGRWVVFYHPGDLGDAWRLGNSGAEPDSVEAAYDTGTNVIYYALRHYIRFHRGMH